MQRVKLYKANWRIAKKIHIVNNHWIISNKLKAWVIFREKIKIYFCLICKVPFLFFLASNQLIGLMLNFIMDTSRLLILPVKFLKTLLELQSRLDCLTFKIIIKLKVRKVESVHWFKKIIQMSVWDLWILNKKLLKKQ